MNSQIPSSTQSRPPEPPTAELRGPCPDDVILRFVARDHMFSITQLDPDAIKVVRRLRRFGHRAFLVGGCVRDLLRGYQPKDFDIATDAEPSQIKKIFRNCRLIGRRFRLAHLHFSGRKIIETATFRREATKEDDLTIRHAAENLFGNAADDAIRRDFTINALMYDVAEKKIYDWTGGLNDIEQGIIRSIGDPDRRLPEDPVRIIRASKFATRLGLTIEPTLQEAMERHAPLLKECSPARLVEEIFKILRSGVSAPCFEQLHTNGVLGILLPVTDHALAARTGNPFHLLATADQKIQQGKPVSDTLLLAALLFPAFQDVIETSKDISTELSERLDRLTKDLPFTKRHMALVKQIFMAQRKLGAGPRNKRSRRLVEREYAVDALNLFEWRGVSTPELMKNWQRLFTQKKPRPSPKKELPRRRRRPRRKKKIPHGQHQQEMSEPVSTNYDFAMQPGKSATDLTKG